jgi:hypothetical protein
MEMALAQTEGLLPDSGHIPQTSYTDYRRFMREGDRRRYEEPYFAKRRILAATALRLFLGRKELKDSVQDYLWSICEESNWVLPAHEQWMIDLFAAETGFMLAETLHMLDDALDAEVRARVRQEVERRIFEPYLRYARIHGWYQFPHNWNGVCNSAVAATFLLLDPEPARTARALEMALEGLRVFLRTAFEDDGSSTEGVGYWQYGLMNLVALSEMLRARSAGRLDLLADDRMRRIAAYPAKVWLSGSTFASFADCDESLSFNPGIVARLAERSGEESLHDLLDRGARLGGDWRLGMMLRDALWWDGRQRPPILPQDAVLPAAGIGRMISRAPWGMPVALAVKAGHNAENHNHNDVGSFILHAGGETYLTDPGRGLYNKSYFSDHRYENIFANSYGHGVPRIGGHLQGAGREHQGRLIEVDTGGLIKTVRMELAQAYAVPELQHLERTLILREGATWLMDEFVFQGEGQPVEEALVTWLDVEIGGPVAHISGGPGTLRLTIEEPAGAEFALEELTADCQANGREGVLKRLTFTVPASDQIRTQLRMAFESPYRA